MIERGQVSIQLIVSVIILFIVFALITSYIIESNKNNATIETSLLLESDCKKLSNAISTVFLNDGTQITITIENNALIKDNGFISIEKQEINALCNYNGIMKKDYELSKGQVTIKNINGVIEIE